MCVCFAPCKWHVHCCVLITWTIKLFTSLWTEGGAVRSALIAGPVRRCMLFLNVVILISQCQEDEGVTALCVFEGIPVGLVFPLSFKDGSTRVWQTLIWMGLQHTRSLKPIIFIFRAGRAGCEEASFYSHLSVLKWIPGPESFVAQWSCKALNCFTRRNYPPEMSLKAIWS